MSSLFDEASWVLIPSGYEEDTVFVQKPTSGGDLTFTRSSDATRTNSAGQIERVAWNLLTYSEIFSDAAWTKRNSTISPNVINAPNGTLTADKVVEAATTGFHSILQTNSFRTGIFQTFSVYLKAAERTWALVWFDSEIAGAYVNLSTGELGTVSSGVTATVTSVGDGWYRCVISKNITSLAPVAVFTATGNNGASYVGNGTSGIYAWGAQLVEGTEAKPYLMTTNRQDVPRLDYRNADGTVSSCCRLLLEPQRTNLILQSEDFTNGWNLESVTVISNTTTAPSNVTAADTLQEAANTDVHRTYRTPITITSGTSYAFTCYVKKDTGRFVRLIFNNSSSSTDWVAAQFDLDTATFTSGVGSGGGTFVSASIRGAANGFYRIELVSSLAATGAFAMIALSNGTAISSADSRGSVSYLGSTSNRVFLWGAQLEAGAYATTYIPTTTAAVTRTAELASRTGASSLIGQTEGTIYWEGFIGVIGQSIFSIRGSTSQNAVVIDVSTVIRASVVTSNVQRFFINSSSFTPGTTYKIAFAYKSGQSALYLNGTQIGTSSVSFSFADTVQTINADWTGYDYGSAQAGTKAIAQAALFPERLTDAQLAELTTI